MELARLCAHDNCLPPPQCTPTQRTVQVPGDAVDGVGVHLDIGDRRVRGLNVPDVHHVVEAGSEDDVLGERVPVHNADAALVSLQGDNRLAEVLGEACRRESGTASDCNQQSATQYAWAPSTAQHSTRRARGGRS